MLVIIGLDALVHALATGWPIAPMVLLSEQFSHAQWAGVHAYDLIFPLFIFLAGVSLAIVDARPSAQTAPRGKKLLTAGRRMAILVLLGIVYNFGWDWSWERLRLPSVLGLIGVSCFLAAATLVFFRSARARLGVGIAIAVLVAALQLLYPVPGHGSGLLTPEGSVNGYIDALILPGRLHGGTYDPEGLLGMLSAATIALAGAGAGAAMLSGRRYGSPVSLCLAGLAISAAGLAIAPLYPPIKALWTVSFDLVAIGICLLLLGAARQLFDLHKPTGFLGTASEALAPIGANAILIYMAARFLVYPLYAPLATLPLAWQLAGLVAVIALQWALLRALFARGWIFRV
jgi:predicted acyltransferase